MAKTTAPIWIKIAYTLFVCAVVPFYWRTYGPANFLWFCDAALLITVVAMWLDSPLLASIEALAMTLPQTIWILDFVNGGHLLGIAAYMFDPGISLLVRGMSTFHIWLPGLLLWMVWRMGYDRRALLIQTILCAALLLASYLLTDPRHPPAYPAAAVNVNRVFGPGATAVQSFMNPWGYVMLEWALFVVCFYVPTHLIFRSVFRSPQRRGSHRLLRWSAARPARLQHP